jgi:hypothetical protein
MRSLRGNAELQDWLLHSEERENENDNPESFDDTIPAQAVTYRPSENRITEDAMKFTEPSTLKVLHDTPQIAELSVITEAPPQKIRDLDLIISIAFRVGHMAGINEAMEAALKAIHNDDRQRNR